MTRALDILDVIDGIVDDTHPEGHGCPLCVALTDLRAALVAPSTPEPSGLLDALGAELVGIEARHAELLQRLGKAIQLLGAAPSTEPALDVERQFAAVDKSLLATFQWSDKAAEYARHAASALLKNLHDIGWDVTVRDPEKAAEYARLAKSQP